MAMEAKCRFRRNKIRKTCIFWEQDKCKFGEEKCPYTHGYDCPKKLSCKKKSCPMLHYRSLDMREDGHSKRAQKSPVTSPHSLSQRSPTRQAESGNSSPILEDFDEELCQELEEVGQELDRYVEESSRLRSGDEDTASSSSSPPPALHHHSHAFGDTHAARTPHENRPDRNEPRLTNARITSRVGSAQSPVLANTPGRGAEAGGEREWQLQALHSLKDRLVDKVRLLVIHKTNLNLQKAAYLENYDGDKAKLTVALQKNLSLSKEVGSYIQSLNAQITATKRKIFDITSERFLNSLSAVESSIRLSKEQDEPSPVFTLREKEMLQTQALLNKGVEALADWKVCEKIDISSVDSDSQTVTGGKKHTTARDSPKTSPGGERQSVEKRSHISTASPTTSFDQHTSTVQTHLTEKSCTTAAPPTSPNQHSTAQTHPTERNHTTTASPVSLDQHTTAETCLTERSHITTASPASPNQLTTVQAHLTERSCTGTVCPTSPEQHTPAQTHPAEKSHTSTASPASPNQHTPAQTRLTDHLDNVDGLSKLLSPVEGQLESKVEAHPSSKNLSTFWCQTCNLFFASVASYVKHLELSEHLDKEEDKQGWAAQLLGHPSEGSEHQQQQQQEEENRCQEAVGVEFLQSTKVIFCRLCRCPILSQEDATLHPHSPRHIRKYKEYIQKDTNQELDFLKAKVAAFSEYCKGRRAKVKDRLGASLKDKTSPQKHSGQGAEGKASEEESYVRKGRHLKTKSPSDLRQETVLQNREKSAQGQQKEPKEGQRVKEGSVTPPRASATPGDKKGMEGGEGGVKRASEQPPFSKRQKLAQ